MVTVLCVIGILASVFFGGLLTLGLIHGYLMRKYNGCLNFPPFWDAVFSAINLF